jgi:septal ring factor EnvC (AmiA/AmiB activator)
MADSVTKAQAEGELELELAATRAALADRERELMELRNQRSAEMARLERQVYWLERFGIDLDALMRRRLVLAAFTVLRSFVRAVRKLTARR